LTILTLVGGSLLQGGGVQTVLAAGADNLAGATILSVPLVNDLNHHHRLQPAKLVSLERAATFLLLPRLTTCIVFGTNTPQAAMAISR
jgi:hypothetical protein